MLDLNEKSVEDALQWMTENDDRLAESKSDYHHLDRFSKTLKAQLMAKESSNMSVSAREQLALANEEFITHLDGLREAEKTRSIRFLLACSSRDISWISRVCMGTR